MRSTRTRAECSFFTLGTNLVLVWGLCLTTSCRKDTKVAATPSLDSNVIASVQGNVINRASYWEKLSERFRQSGTELTIARKEAVLDEMIRHEAVYAQAKAAEFDQQSEVAALIKNLVVSRFIEHELGGEGPSVTSEEIQNYYRNHSTEFVTPGTVRAATIFFRSSARMSREKREELKQQAQLVLAEAQQTKSEADFIRLVQRHSEDQSTRYRGGDLGWLTRAQCDAALGAEVSTALCALSEPDSFAPLLETSDGFYILKLRERKETQARPLAEVEEIIRYRLIREQEFQRKENFYARMKQGLDVQINRPLLESISIPQPEHNPPGLPGSGAAQRIAIR